MLALNIFVFALFGSMALLLIFSVFQIIITEGIQKMSFNNKRRKNDEFVDYLLQGIINETINNYDDLVKLFRGVNTNINNREMEIKVINNNLYTTFVKITNKKYAKELGIEKLNEIKIKISEYISINNKETLFLDLPVIEKTIFKDIITFLELNNKEEVIKKITELNDIIITRYEEQKKLIKLNKFSMPVAIISIIITIVFGIISIILYK